MVEVKLLLLLWTVRKNSAWHPKSNNKPQKWSWLADSHRSIIRKIGIRKTKLSQWWALSVQMWYSSSEQHDAAGVAGWELSFGKAPELGEQKALPSLGLTLKTCWEARQFSSVPVFRTGGKNWAFRHVKNTKTFLHRALAQTCTLLA